MASHRARDAEWCKALVVALTPHQAAAVCAVFNRLRTDAQGCGEAHMNKLAAEQHNMMAKARAELAAVPSYKVSGEVTTDQPGDCVTIAGPTTGAQ